MSAMISDLEGYFRGLVPPGDALLLELEEEAKRESIPIVGPVVGELLFVLARATGAARILELGTATGYSGIFLGRACAEINGRVVSLEYDEAMATRARANLARAGLAEVVEVRVGEALKLMARDGRDLRPDLPGHRQGILPAGPVPLPPPVAGRGPAGGGQYRIHRGRGLQPGNPEPPRLARRSSAEFPAPPFPGA